MLVWLLWNCQWEELSLERVKSYEEEVGGGSFGELFNILSCFVSKFGTVHQTVFVYSH